MGTLNDIQIPLFRAFSEECYAADFATGKFRLSVLTQYRSIEDISRQDSEEGHGHYKDRHGHDWNFELGGRIYILCLSRPEVDQKYLREHMGAFIVQVNDPAKLACDIELSLRKQGIKTFNGVHGGLVKYTKGRMVIEELDPIKRAFLSVTQKPESYAPEYEYRLFTILNEDPKTPARDFINIDVGAPFNYVQVLQ